MAFNIIPHPLPAHRVRRFWKHVTRKGADECWPFSHANQRGYAQIRVLTVETLAHRVAWTVTNGPIPKGVCVLHRCDNPRCCNPNHLFLGSKGDNNRDRSAKGRTARGSRHWKSVLSEVDVPRVAEMRKSGMTQQAIAEHFGVQQPAIWKILNGRTWGTVKRKSPAPI